MSQKSLVAYYVNMIDKDGNKKRFFQTNASRLASLAIYILAINVVISLIATMMGGKFLFGSFLLHTTLCIAMTIVVNTAFKNFDRLVEVWHKIAFVVAVAIVLVYLFVEFFAILLGL